MIWLSLVFASALVVGASFQARAVWREGRDIAKSAEWFIGRSGNAGYNAMLAPNLVAAAAVICSVFLLQFTTDHGVLFFIAGVLGATAMSFMILGAWLFLFMRPRFLVPPAYRGQPGWVVASWRSRRHTHKDEPPRHAG